MFVQDVLVHRDEIIQPMRRVELPLRGQTAHIHRHLQVVRLAATLSIDEDRKDEQDENESAAATADATNQRHWRALLIRER